MFLNFFTGYYDEDDALEMRKLRICKHYLRSWFIIDFISCLPVQYIFLLYGQRPPEGADSAKLLKCLRLFRLAKLWRLGKLRGNTSAAGASDTPIIWRRSRQSGGSGAKP